MEQLYLLRAFVAAARHRSFSKAADSLGVTTGSISKAIAKLEASVQTRLLHRTTRSVMLTEQAQPYFVTCQRLLEELDEANRRLTQECEIDSGKLRLVIHPMLSGETLSILMARYRAFAPNVNLVVSVHDGPVNLYESKYDMAVQLPELVEQSAVIRRSLLISSRILVAAPRYLERNGRPIRANDLSQHLLLLPSHLRQRNSDRIELLENGESIGVVPQSSIDGYDVFLQSAAQASTGIAALPEAMVRRDLANGSLVPVLSDCTVIPGDIELCLFYPHRDLLPMRFRVFIDFCTAFFRETEICQRRALRNAAPELVHGSASALEAA